jgi:hypothetical protein
VNLGHDIDSETKEMFPVMRLYEDMRQCGDYWKRTAIQICEQVHRDFCARFGNLFGIRNQVRESHDVVQVLDAEESKWIRLSLPLVQPFRIAILTPNKLFFLVSFIEENTLYFLLFHVGHNNDSSGYIYDFKIQRSDNHYQRFSESLSTCKCHDNLKNLDEIDVSREYVTLHFHSINGYLTDIPAMTCDINIRTTATTDDDHMIESMDWTTSPADLDLTNNTAYVVCPKCMEPINIKK